MSRTGSRVWRRTREEILSESDVCWLCGHLGSDSIDHVVPVALGGTDDIENLMPAHFKPCPTCGVPCNLKKSNKLTYTPSSAPGPSKDYF